MSNDKQRIGQAVYSTFPMSPVCGVYARVCGWSGTIIGKSNKVKDGGMACEYALISPCCFEGWGGENGEVPWQ